MCPSRGEECPRTGPAALWWEAKTDYGDVVHTEQSRSAFSQIRLAEFADREGARAESVTVLEWPSELGSTNTRLAELVAGGIAVPDFAVLGTDHQTGGQGRLGRTWTVPASAALTFSVPVAVPPGTDPGGLGWIPVVTGLAVTRALAGMGVRAGIKWPNDVLSGQGRKLCGILSRLVTGPEGGPTVVIGCGVNVSLTREELPVDTATSVLLEGGAPDREAVLAGILEHLPGLVRSVFARGTDFSRTQEAAEVRAAMVTLGARVRVHLPGERTLVGTAAGLDEEANLLVRPEGADPRDEPVRVTAGDVVHVRPA